MLSDLALWKTLQRIDAHDTDHQLIPQSVLAAEMACLAGSMMDPHRRVGSGDVYDRIIEYGPFGSPIGRLVKKAAGELGVFKLFVVLRERTIADKTANVYRYAAIDADVLGVQSVGQLAAVTAGRYPAKTAETWALWTAKVQPPLLAHVKFICFTLTQTPPELTHVHTHAHAHTPLDVVQPIGWWQGGQVPCHTAVKPLSRDYIWTRQTPDSRSSPPLIERVQDYALACTDPYSCKQRRSTLLQSHRYFQRRPIFPIQPSSLIQLVSALFKHLAKPVCRLPRTYDARVRMTSAILGASKRQYIRGEVLHGNEGGNPTVFKAKYTFCALSPFHHISQSLRCGNKSVVFKQESKSIFDLSRRLADEFAGSCRLRMPIDFNPEDRTVVYPYFTNTLLSLMRADPDFPPAELRKILRCVGEAIQEFHTNGWLHLGTLPRTRKLLCKNAHYSVDVKPDNIFVNWTCGDDGSKTVTDAALGDLALLTSR